jgi:hypothetical protein
MVSRTLSLPAQAHTVTRSAEGQGFVPYRRFIAANLVRFMAVNAAKITRVGVGHAFVVDHGQKN